MKIDCQFLGCEISGGWECTLGYWGGKTTAKQCQICIALGRNNEATAHQMRSNPKEAWKMNSYNKKELYEALDKINGFGDIVYKVAQPIAKTLDAILKTNISNCGGCKRRREKLNKLFPIDDDQKLV